MDTNPVPNVPDQVDLNYHVKEVNAGKASIQGGYSTSDGFIYGASLSNQIIRTGKYGRLILTPANIRKVIVSLMLILIIRHYGDQPLRSLYFRPSPRPTPI